MGFTDTPKATLGLSNIGPGMSGKNVSYGIVNKLQWRKKDLVMSIKASDRTAYPFSGLKKMTDVVLTADQKLVKGVTLNTELEAGTKKYKGGLTWDGKLAKKAAQVKGWYTNKDKLAAGEATFAFNVRNKLNTTFNQKQMLTAKFTTIKKGLTVEPSYNFVKKSPAVAVTKRVKKDALKMSYDLKSESAALEWNHVPKALKITLSAPVGKKNKVGKPSLSAVYEKTFNL